MFRQGHQIKRMLEGDSRFVKRGQAIQCDEVRVKEESGEGSLTES